MNSTSAYNPWLHRFAVLTACATFMLVIAGALVTSTDSGLAVPDWPLSYGQVMPPMVGGIFYEHGHRMVATFVGFLTTVLAVWLWRTEKRRWVKALGWAALAAVIVQGVLGGLTVLHLLPPPISVAHATLAQSFFSLTLVIALVTSRGWLDMRRRERESSRTTRRIAVAVVATVLLQLILGAVMRHTQSGLAIPDFPMSYGGWLPPMSPESMPDINRERLALDLGPVTFSQIWIHFAHRVGALLTTVVILLGVTHIVRRYPAEQRLREPALLLAVLLGVQIFLGALTVLTGKHVAVATGHVATGALMLAISVFIAVRVFGMFSLPARMTAPVFAAEGGRS